MLRIEQVTAKALERVGNDKYLLTAAVSKRSNELANGAQALIVVDSKKVKFTDIALQEIAEGLILVSCEN
jgi:DNA-directed RNA polymerase subunit omega